MSSRISEKPYFRTVSHLDWLWHENCLISISLGKYGEVIVQYDGFFIACLLKVKEKTGFFLTNSAEIANIISKSDLTAH